MKKLILMRHSIAANHPSFNDLERPLTEEGSSKASKASKVLFNIIPDHIIFSPAVRTKQTSFLVLETLKLSARPNLISISNELYYNDVENIYDKIKETDGKINNLMIVGHNPTISKLANSFQIDSEEIYFEPATIVIFELNINTWKEIKSGNHKLVLLEK